MIVFRGWILLAGLLAAWGVTAGAAERRPNVLLIYVDDAGYADVGCQGSADIPTPHIDSIAKAGVRFTDGYVTAPVCSPSRAGLLTGRYQQRFGHEFNVDFLENADLGLAPAERTFADDLKAGGYKTGLVGKWHMGLAEDAHPLKRGFDEFFGFLGGRHPYIRRQGLESFLYRGTEKVDEREYLTHAFSREAASFIERHRAGPWCLYLAYNAPHVPMEAPPRYLDRVKQIPDEKRRVYAAMMVALDDGVGTVLKKLAETGQEQDTLVFFISDNGGRLGVADQGPFSGGKQLLSEGGIRVPFLMQWKGKVPAGQVYSKPVISLDAVATALSIAGIERAADRRLDGVNLLPFVTGERSEAPHEYLFWRQWPAAAVRAGKWKLMRSPANGAELRLYDLEADPSEKSDVAATHPEVVERMKGALGAWEAQMVEPKWEAAVPRGGELRDVTTGKKAKGKKPQAGAAAQ